MPSMKRSGDFSLATVFHATCSIVLSRQFHQEEVILGRLVTGRSSLPSSLQNVVGPCLCEIPIRISLKPNDTVSGVAMQLQRQFVEDSLHEGPGMDEITRHCTCWSEHAKDFGWRTAFQQGEESNFNFLGSPSNISTYERDLLSRTCPEIYATPRGETLELMFEGNKRLISLDTAREFLLRLQAALTEF